MEHPPLSQSPPAPVSSVRISAGSCPPLDDLDLTSAYPVGDIADLQRLNTAMAPRPMPWRR